MLNLTRPTVKKLIPNHKFIWESLKKGPHTKDKNKLSHHHFVETYRRKWMKYYNHFGEKIERNNYNY
jgi:hypothetical protein